MITWDFISNEIKILEMFHVNNGLPCTVLAGGRRCHQDIRNLSFNVFDMFWTKF